MACFNETSCRPQNLHKKCRLCRKTITDKGFQLVDGEIRGILDFLLLKLEFSVESIDVICNTCRRQLDAALEFKSTCLNTDYTISPHVHSDTMLQLDLEVCTQKNGIGHSSSNNLKICQLCMQLIKGEVRCIGEEELEFIHNFVPEMIIRMNKKRDPVLCKPCFDSLYTHNSFLKDCVELGQGTEDIFGRSAIKSQPRTSLPVSVIKTEILDINEEELLIKTEGIDIKLEDEEMSDTLLLHSNNETLVDSDCKDADEKEIKPSEVQLYKCRECDFQAKFKSTLRNHVLKHKHRSEVQMYKCDACDRGFKYKSSFIRHQLKHKHPSEVQLYKCNECDFQAKFKCTLKNHVLKHKDPSEVQMYKCEACDYESRCKHNLNEHQLTHKDPMEVQLYKCGECDFQTKYRGSFKHHALVHKEPSQVQIYICAACNFESRYKQNFNRHQLKHKV